jgi:hypothetical protein
MHCRKYVEHGTATMVEKLNILSTLSDDLDVFDLSQAVGQMHNGEVNHRIPSAFRAQSHQQQVTAFDSTYEFGDGDPMAQRSELLD